MRKKVTGELKPEATGSETRRKPGRRPMTAEQKEAAAKIKAAEKEKADNLKPEVYMQFRGSDISMDALAVAAKDDFHKTKKRTLVTAMQIYVKPEERIAYYVINGAYTGSIKF